MWREDFTPATDTCASVQEKDLKNPLQTANSVLQKITEEGEKEVGFTHISKNHKCPQNAIPQLAGHAGFGDFFKLKG